MFSDLIFQPNNKHYSRDFCEISSTAFLHTDLVEKDYLCYLLPRTSKLQFIPLEKTSNGNQFGKISTVFAKDAIRLKKMKMIAVLDPSGTLIMYTGPNLLSKIHISGNIPLPVNKRLTLNSPFPRRSSLLPSAKPAESSFNEALHALSPVHPLQPSSSSKRMTDVHCLSLRDPAGNRITLVYPDGKMLRITVPLINETYLVKKCLKALRKIIQKEDYVQFISKFYGSRNAPGANDLSLEREWEIFKTTLSEFLGRSNSPLNESMTAEEPKTNKKRKTDEEEDMGCDEDWEFLISIIHKKEFGNVKDSSDNKEVDTSAPLFHQIPLVFFTFHLLYEELKIHWSIHCESIKFLGEFLFQLAFDMKLKNYCYAYNMDFPQLCKYSSMPCFTESNGQMMQNKELLLNRQMPSIFNTLQNILNGKDKTKYPCIDGINTNSRNVIQLLTLVFHGVAEIKTWIDDLEYGRATTKKNRRMISRHASKGEQLIQMLVNMSEYSFRSS